MAEDEDAENKSVYIGQVDYSTTPQQLGEHFKSAGAVARVTIVGYPMAPQGYAYLEFESSEGKQAAIDTLDNTDFNGRTLKVCAKRKNVMGYNLGKGGKGKGKGKGKGFPGKGKGGAAGRGYSYGELGLGRSISDLSQDAWGNDESSSGSGAVEPRIAKKASDILQKHSAKATAEASGAGAISVKKKSLLDRLGPDESQKKQGGKGAQKAAKTEKAGLKGAATEPTATAAAAATTSTLATKEGEKIQPKKDSGGTPTDAPAKDIEVIPFAELMRRKREAASQAAAGGAPAAKRTRVPEGTGTSSEATPAISTAEAEAEVERALAETDEPSEAIEDKDASTTEAFNVNQRVVAQWGDSDDWYSGHITAIHSDGTCDIAYDDGDNEEGKDPALIQLEPGTPRE